MKHLKKFNEGQNDDAWVAALDDNYIYIPISCEKSMLYKGKGALPHFDTKEECQKWCDENPYKGNKPQLDCLLYTSPSPRD